MPNWCHNDLEIHGPEDALGRFHAAHVMPGDNDGLVFTFEGSVPMPGVLRKVHRGGAVIGGESVTVWWARGGEKVRIADRTLTFLRARYGATDWYEWATDNWGVKWDAGAVRYDASPGFRRYQFETAWGPPVEWAEKASALYPELRLSIQYDEPGMGFVGTFVVEGGEVLVDESSDDENADE